MLQRTGKILIHNSGVAAQTGSVQVKDPTVTATFIKNGEVAVLDERYEPLGSKTYSASYGATTTSKIIIAQGTGNGKVRFSNPIDGNLLLSVKAEPYAAIVEKTWEVVKGTTFTPIIGQEYVVRIVYRDIEETRNQYTFWYRWVADSTVYADLVTAIKTSINNDKKAKVVASGTTSLVITAKDIVALTSINDIDNFRQTDFDIFLSSGNWGDSVLNNNLLSTFNTADGAAIGKFTYGSGCWPYVRDIEKTFKAYEGVTNYINFPVSAYATQFYTEAGGNYDFIAFEHDASYQSPDNQYVKRAPLTTIVAFPNTNAVGTAVASAINTWTASTPRKFAAVTL